MRIVGGIYKGRKLLEFTGEDIRPTSDMTRESLFNIINCNIIDKSFLDLFCGTGAVGLEALSRGANEVTLNDIARDSVALAKKNAQKIGATNIEVTNLNAITFIEKCNKTFDYIFIDAPYKDNVGIESLNICHKILNDGGRVIYENEIDFVGEIYGLEIADKRKYGRAHLTFFKKKDE